MVRRVRFLDRYTDDQLLAELRRVAAVVDGVLTRAVFDELSEASSATVRRRFGSWRDGLVAAGLEYRSAHRRVTPRMGRQRTRRLNNEEIIAELRQLSERLGSSAITLTDVEDNSPVIGSGVLMSRFGSFAAACEAAGRQPLQGLRSWTAD
jgi:hypothetical protein